MYGLVLGPTLSGCTQSSATFSPQPFWNIAERLKYSFVMELDADGENTIDKTVFENNITIEQVSRKDGKVIIKMIGDRPNNTNASFAVDGEGIMLNALLGIDIVATFDSNGHLLQIENKDDMVKEFKAGFPTVSRAAMVDEMLAENDSFVFARIYEINYGALFKNLQDLYKINQIITSDSVLIDSNRKVTQHTILETSRDAAGYSAKTTVTSQQEKYVEEFDTYSVINHPISTESTEHIQWNRKGLMTSYIIQNKTTIGGYVMVINGKEVDKPNPVTTITTYKYQLKDAE